MYSKPICRCRPLFFSASTIATHSVSVGAMGFSQNTCAPARSAAIVAGAWPSLALTTATTSGFSRPFMSCSTVS